MTDEAERRTWRATGPALRAAKELPSLDAAFDACGIGDGAVLSFHHHLRNGDAVLAQVLAVAAGRGIGGLGLAPTAVFPSHAALAAHFAHGTVERVWTSYMTGAAADAVARGALAAPMVFLSHGCRAAAVERRRIPVDVAFIAAPVATPEGDLTGATGRAAFGPLGYPQSDARAARHRVALVEEIRPGPLPRVEIPGARIDHIVRVGSIGDPAGILSGATRLARDPTGLAIARRVAAAVAASGHLREGLSLQTGAGGVSLAAAAEIGTAMEAAGVRGGVLSGGIAAAHVDLLRRGLFREIRDVQCFDREAVASYAADPRHRAMSAAEYASPDHPDPVAGRLDVVVLGAAEIDRDFDINVITAGDGRIIGGPGGHPDTAAGAKLTVAATRLTAEGYPKVVARVGTVTTPGRDVDLLVTEAGIAVSPARPELAARLREAGLPMVSVEELIARSAALSERSPRRGDGPEVAVIEDRAGGLLDRVRRIGGD